MLISIQFTSITHQLYFSCAIPGKMGSGYTHLLYNALFQNIIVGFFFISVSTCILERVFFHLEGMCSGHK